MGRKTKLLTIVQSAGNDHFSGTYLMLECTLRWRTDQLMGFLNSECRSSPLFRLRSAVGYRAKWHKCREVKQDDLSMWTLTDYMKSANTELWLAGLMEEPHYRATLFKLALEGGLIEKVSFDGSRSDEAQLSAMGDLYMMP